VWSHREDKRREAQEKESNALGALEEELIDLFKSVNPRGFLVSYFLFY